MRVVRIGARRGRSWQILPYRWRICCKKKSERYAKWGRNAPMIHYPPQRNSD